MSEAPSSRRLLAVPFVAKARGDGVVETDGHSKNMYKGFEGFLNMFENV